MMRKKYIIILLIMLIIMLNLSTYVNANSSFSAQFLAENAILKAGETVSIKLKVYDINMDNGIMALSGKLTFDENVFESISVNNLGAIQDNSLSKIIAAENWSSPSYSPSTKKLVIDANKFITSPSNVLEIILKVKDNIEVTETTISLTDIWGSNGEEDIAASKDISITIKKDNTTKEETNKDEGNKGQEDKNNGNNNINNNGVNNTNGGSSVDKKVTSTNSSNTELSKTTTSQTKLPKAGINKIFIISTIIAIVIISVIFYNKYYKIKDAK